jgi:hypothetical protein
VLIGQITVAIPYCSQPCGLEGSESFCRTSAKADEEKERKRERERDREREKG